MGLFDIFKVSEYKKQIEELTKQNIILQNQLNSLCYNDYESAQNTLTALRNQISQQQSEANRIIEQNNNMLADMQKTEKQLKTAINKLNKSRELYKSMEYSITNFFEYEPNLNSLKLNPDDYSNLEEISPSVILKLHYMDIKSLRKAYNDNNKLIEKLLSQYQKRYTTKANLAIYELMVIALRAELQNVLYNLKYEKLDKAVDQVKSITMKYLEISSNGNKSIAGTLTKFIGEIEYLFINAVKIEYNYYVKKEQARQEQLAIREQMKQEAEERKALEQEKKQIEKEESKYTTEIDKLNDLLINASDEKQKTLQAKILELQAKLSEIAIKKDSITKLQNGKAGNVYVISNLGSFGENVFKVGMTRRLEPMDRINELGNASVPFKFDVHSLIFSDDAVGLENKLHSILNNKRVNKVNSRKEFFYTTVDELETIVNDIDPTAEFTKTMVADEYRQSQSTTENYTSDYSDEDEDDE